MTERSDKSTLPYALILDQKMRAFAEFRTRHAFVQRWTKHYTDRGLMTESDARLILNDAEGKTVLAPEHAEKVLEELDGGGRCSF